MALRYDCPLQAYRQTLCGGLSDLNTVSEFVQFTTATFPTFVKWHAADLDQSDLRGHQDVESFTSAYTEVSIGRVLAMTSTGYIGWVPKQAKEDDHIVLLPGGKVSYALRELEETTGGSAGTARYAFLGDCYIHGIMFGEAWDASKLQPITLV